ncbi:L,D-transpeptidase [Luteolibacter flavescens]|uniref:L,D-transpeptidase n=1 Tax=Luteolibacter flavescens TaxID=1859460 RepID=A0ABT3FJR5_9BACT|nr:L,D-transpeptidase [Luteolibacter flavescens]MCW1883255.1 L,D-transpeptidase [Luteolibacter flavescens]
MFRKSVAAAVLATVFTADADPLRALPVDPSEITPEEKAATPPAPAPAAVVQQCTPIAPGVVKMPEQKKNIKTDAPEVANLPTGEDAIRLQVFLDQSNFGPGIIDGKPGRFTIQAVASWNEVHGHEAHDMGPVMAAARKAVPNAFGMAIVPDVATKWVNSGLSHNRAAQAKAKRMSYRSIAEFMAERYHTDVDFILELNGSKNTWGVKTGGTLIVPNVKPFLIENVNGKRYEADPTMSERHAVVDTVKNQVRIFEGAPPALLIEEDEPVSNQPVLVKPKSAPVANRALVASFPITPGKPQFIHKGVWKMNNSVELPVWRYDQSLLDTGKRSNNALNIPPGPNSPVGIIWNGLSKPGIGLHGTSDPETIGRARSAGCIRLANWDAIRIPTLIRPGATVEIR